MRLAEIDKQRFITACRHGLVHLTWGRTTIRLSRDEFRRLAGFLERAADALPPASVGDGTLSVICRLDGDCELRLGALVLLLSPDEFQELSQAARQGVDRLDTILASGVWDREESQEPPPSPLDQLGQVSFSNN
jgi:hypothetical protein